MADCTFCGIVAGRKSARMVREWPDVVAFRDKNELVPDGHILVVPRLHVVNGVENPRLTGRVAECAAELASEFEYSNVLYANGAPATQSEFHLHMHVVRRAPQDGLMMPWGTTGNPHAPHACTRSLEAEKKLDNMRLVFESLRTLASAINLNTETKTTRSRCPWCGSDAFHVNEDKNIYYCFGCGRGGALEDYRWINRPVTS